MILLDALNKLKLTLGLETVKEKYSHQKNNISEYLKEVNDIFYSYAEATDNYAFESILEDIVSGEDCEGYVAYVNPKALYHWKVIDGCTSVSEVDYDLLTELVDKAIEVTEEKEKDYDIC